MKIASKPIALALLGLAACPMMKAGDVFYADYAKPQGFCDEAWNLAN